jgi:2-polyprenyl-3-methyl-5-hydroxy-6-metoxy-1,4-benzoquinol methylase
MLLSRAAMELTIPEATEAVPCPLCGETTGIVVGERGRFGMAVRNVCCDACATVYVSPRPTRAAMAEYYRSTYRDHYGGVGYADANGKGLTPDASGYADARLRWHQQQADNALRLTPMREGARVLEIGCRDGKTLDILRERKNIVPFGVEPGENEAEQARHAGIDCFTGALEDFTPGEGRFDHVQCFHVLEHVQDPLGALLKLRSLLAPGGTLLIEVPNVYQPYGLLEENFFQNVHLVSYSPNTLPALARRAGLEVTRVVDSGALFVVATPRALSEGESLPLPFTRSLLSQPSEDAAWLGTRLRSYASLEKLQLLFKHRGPSPELTGTLVRALAFPAFDTHMVNACAFFIEQLCAHGRFDDALMVTLAVAQGPHPLELRQQFRAFAERLGAPADVLAAVG